MTTTAPSPATYPARLNIDYVGAGRDRLTTLIRPIMLIPILLIFWGFGNTLSTLISFPVLLMLLFRQKYPRWWFDYNLEYQRYSTRFMSYASLLSDDYPSTDDQQGVRLEIDYPDAKALNRWMPLVKWILAIPHYIVLMVIGSIAIVLVLIGWFIVLFTGSFPKMFHDFIVASNRWALRVTAYMLILTTDEYPPFSLD